MLGWNLGQINSFPERGMVGPEGEPATIIACLGRKLASNSKGVMEEYDNDIKQIVAAMSVNGKLLGVINSRNVLHRRYKEILF